MNKIEIDYDSLPWWAQPLLVAILGWQDPEELKRYAELAGNGEPQELEDKKLQG